MQLYAVCLLLVAALSAVSCSAGMSSESNRPPREVSGASPVTDYSALVASLRAAGTSVKPGAKVEQPFFSVIGRSLQVDGEDVQVFEYPDAAAADAQAAQVSPTGTGIGTTRIHWIGPPHFYKKGRLLVLYIGDNDIVLSALETVLGPQFAGSARSR